MTDDAYDRRDWRADSYGCWLLACAEMRRKLLRTGEYTIEPQNDEERALVPAPAVFDGSWRRACEIVVTSRKAVDSMIRRHYLGKWPGVCVLVLALRRASDLLGVIVFALPPRETSKRYGGTTWELARLWVDDAVPKNGETWFIAQSVKYIRKHHGSVEVLVSYADPSAGHSGTIYKAANWQPDGRTDDERKTPRFDYADAITGKRFSRRGHIPPGLAIERIPRVSKHRFIYRMKRNEQC